MRFPRFHTISVAVLGVLTAAAIAVPVTGGAAVARAATTTATSCTALVSGPPVTMKVTTPGKAATCTFSGKVGQRISTVVTNLVINSGSGGSGCATLTLLNPSGGVVDSSGLDCGFSSIGLTNAPDVLTASGTYTVRLELDQTDTGTAQLWVSTPVTVGTVAINGPPVSMNVTRVGQGVQRTFTGKAGQRISTVITNLVINSGSGGSGCATLTLLNPSGGVVDSSGLDCGFSSIGLTNAPDVLTVSGTYTVRLELDQTDTGTAKLWVSTPVTVGTVTVNGPPVSMNVTRVGQGVQRTFTGTAGQQINTVVTNLVINSGSGGSGCATLTLLNPKGGQVDSSGQDCGSSSIGIGPDKLLVSGTYTVRLELDQTATGSGTLQVST